MSVNELFDVLGRRVRRGRHLDVAVSRRDFLLAHEERLRFLNVLAQLLERPAPDGFGVEGMAEDILRALRYGKDVAEVVGMREVRKVALVVSEGKRPRVAARDEVGEDDAERPDVARFCVVRAVVVLLPDALCRLEVSTRS